MLFSCASPATFTRPRSFLPQVVPRSQPSLSRALEDPFPPYTPPRASTPSYI